MGKLMISLSDEMEAKIREKVKRVYHGRVGGLSIFFETLIRDYFVKADRPRKAKGKA